MPIMTMSLAYDRGRRSDDSPKLTSANGVRLSWHQLPTAGRVAGASATAKTLVNARLTLHAVAAIVAGCCWSVGVA